MIAEETFGGGLKSLAGSVFIVFWFRPELYACRKTVHVWRYGTDPFRNLFLNSEQASLWLMFELVYYPQEMTSNIVGNIAGDFIIISLKF